MHRHPLYDRLNLCHFFFIVSEFVCSIPNLDSLSVLNKFLLDVQYCCLLIGNWLMVMQAVKLLVPVRQKTIKKSNNLFLYPVRSPLPHSDIIDGDSLGLSRILWAPEAVCVGVCTCNTWVIFGTTPSLVSSISSHFPVTFTWTLFSFIVFDGSQLSVESCKSLPSSGLWGEAHIAVSLAGVSVTSVNVQRDLLASCSPSIVWCWSRSDLAHSRSSFHSSSSTG